MSLSPLTRGLFGLALSLALGAATAGSALAASIKLGVMGGSEEEIAEVAKQVAAKHGLDVQLVTFSDYAIPNEALENGDLDANAFQHKPYLDAQIAARGYHIVPIGFTIVEPIGLYSKKFDKLEKLPDGAKIGIPNDPSNGGRALNRGWGVPVSGRWWTDKGSKRKLKDAEALQAAIAYVRKQPNALVIYVAGKSARVGAWRS